MFTQKFSVFRTVFCKINFTVFFEGLSGNFGKTDVANTSSCSNVDWFNRGIFKNLGCFYDIFSINKEEPRSL